MSTENLIYISQSEYDALRRRTATPVWGWWLSGVAVGFTIAVACGWAQ